MLGSGVEDFSKLEEVLGSMAKIGFVWVASSCSRLRGQRRVEGVLVRACEWVAKPRRQEDVCHGQRPVMG